MCGIWAFAGPAEPDPNVLWSVASEASRRGPHAWGAVTPSAGGGFDRVTGAGHISSAAVRRLSRHRTILGQARMATSGDWRDDANTPPLVGAHAALAHNGTIPSYREIALAESLALATGNDSEVALGLVDREPTPDHFAAVIAHLARDAPVAAIAVLQGAIVAYRCRHPLYVLTRPEGLYLGSRPLPDARLLAEGELWSVMR